MFVVFLSAVFTTVRNKPANQLIQINLQKKIIPTFHRENIKVFFDNLQETHCLLCYHGKIEIFPT
jgi:hypothetical protein